MGGIKKKPTLADLQKSVRNYKLPKDNKDYLKALFKNNPKKLFENIDKYKNKPWAFKFYSKLLTHQNNLTGINTEYAFKYLPKYKDASWAPKFLILALKVTHTLSKKEIYKGLGVAGKNINANVKEKILHIGFDYIFKTLKDFKDMKINGKPIYKDILIMATKTFPGNLFREFPQLKKMLPADFQIKLLKLAIKKDPFAAIFALQKIKDWNYAKKILLLLTKELKGSLLFDYMFSSEIKVPWIDKFFKEVFKDEWSYLIFDYAKNIKKLKNSDKLFLKAIDKITDKQSKYIFFSANHLKTIKPAEIIFTKAVNKDCEFFFKYFKKFKEKNWAEKLAKISARRFPGKAIYHMNKFNDIPYLKEIFNISANYSHNIEYRYMYSKKFLKNVNKFATSKIAKDKILARKKEAKLIKDLMIGKKQKIKMPKGIKKYTNSLFYNDKAIQKILRLKEKWLGPPYQKTVFKRAQFRVMIIRNLFYRGMKVNEINVRQMYLQVLKQRAKYSKKPLFKGRSVVYMANNERGFFRGNLFGRKMVRKYIKQQCGEKNWNFIREDSNDVNKLKAAKIKLFKMVESKPKLTLILDGHGSEDAISLAHGQLKGMVGAKVKTKSKSDHINYKELADSLAKRAKKFPNEDPPILVLTSCFNAVFVRRLHSRLRKLKAPLPITLGSAEYGQLVKRKYMPWDKIFAGLFKKLKLGKIKTTTFQQIFDNEENDMNNPTITIPAKDKKQLQIGRNTKEIKNRRIV